MNGKQLGAGTADPEAYICIVGSNGHSGKLYLQSLLSMRSLTGQTLHRGTWDNLIIESSGDLGEIQVVILGIDKSALLGASWYVHEVGVYNFQSKTQEAFPCCFWIGNGESVSFTSKTSKKFNFGHHDIQTCSQTLIKGGTNNYYDNRDLHRGNSMQIISNIGGLGVFPQKIFDI